MATGNGIFDTQENAYVPYPLNQWDDYQASSAGDDWDSLELWFGTPGTSVTITTDVYDTRLIRSYNPISYVACNIPIALTLNYSNTIDSAGALVSPTTVNYTIGSSVSAVTARYFQWTVTAENDSANDEIPKIFTVDFKYRTDTNSYTVGNIDTSTLTGSVGQREVELPPSFGTVISMIVTPHKVSTDPYIATGYVASDYVSTGVPSRAHITIDKSGSNPVLNITELNTFGKTKFIDCTVDLMLEGMPSLAVADNGNIEEQV